MREEDEEPEEKEDPLAFYWQVSDDVPYTVITTASQECQRDDCELSARIGGTTCMGVWNHYDKFGNKIITDRNRFDCYLHCRQCKTGWRVDNNGKILEKKEY